MLILAMLLASTSVSAVCSAYNNATSYYSYDTDYTDVGTGNWDGTNSGCSLVSAKLNTGAQCTAAESDYVTIGDVTYFDAATTKISFSFWINQHSTVSNGMIFDKIKVGAPIQGWSVYFSGTTDKLSFSFYSGGSQLECRSATTVTKNTWEYWTIVYDGDRTDCTHVKFYLNGVLKTTDSVTDGNPGADTSNAVSLNLNQRGDGASHLYNNATYDEFMVYPGILDVGAIGALYAAGAGCNPYAGGPGASLTLNSKLHTGEYGLFSHPEYFINQANFSFFFNGTAANTKNIHNCTLYLNSTTSQTKLNLNLSKNQNFTLDTQSWAKGYWFNVTCKNNNATGSFKYNVYIDNIRPVIQNFPITWNNNTVYFKDMNAANITINTTWQDSNLLAINRTIYNSTNGRISTLWKTNITTMTYNNVTYLNLNNRPPQRYRMVEQAWDDHNPITGVHESALISETKADLLKDQPATLELTYKTGVVEIQSMDVSDYRVVDEDNKYKLEFALTKTEGATIKLMGLDLWQFRNSEHKAHFASVELGKYFDLDSEDIQVTDIQADKDGYLITFNSKAAQVKTNSIGDLNYVHTTYFFNVSNTRNIFAKSLGDNLTIQTFSVWIRNSGYSNIWSTTTGIIKTNVTGKFNLTYFGLGYINRSYLNIDLDATHNHTGYLNATNAFKVYVRDQETNQYITQPVKLEFIGSINATNFTAVNGVKYIVGLMPDNYIIRYSTANYSNAYYYFTLVNGTNIQFTIYMLKNYSTDEVTAIVVDEVQNTLEGAYIHVQRYNLNTNTFNTVEILKTNFEGQTVLHVQKSTEFYKFLIYYNGILKKSTAPTYIYQDSITFQIQLGSSIAEDFYKIQGISYSLSYNPSTKIWRYIYADQSGTATSGTLKLYLVNSTSELLTNSSTVSAASGTIYLGNRNISGATYRADGYVLQNGKQILIAQDYYTFPTPTIQQGKQGLFYAMLVCLLFAMIGFYDLTVACIITPLPILLFAAIGWIDITIMQAIPIELLGFILAFIINRNKS